MPPTTPRDTEQSHMRNTKKKKERKKSTQIALCRVQKAHLLHFAVPGVLFLPRQSPCMTSFCVFSLFLCPSCINVLFLSFISIFFYHLSTFISSLK